MTQVLVCRLEILFWQQLMLKFAKNVCVYALTPPGFLQQNPGQIRGDLPRIFHLQIFANRRPFAVPVCFRPPISFAPHINCRQHNSMSLPEDNALPIPNPPVGKTARKMWPWIYGYRGLSCVEIVQCCLGKSHCGAHQKGKQFQESMLTLYNRLSKEQIEKDQAILDKCSAITWEEYFKNGMGKHIPSDRTFDSIYYRFKSILAPGVMKFMGIMETTDMASGWSEDDHKTSCLELYKKRQGKTFDHYDVYEYLRNKQKFSTFRSNQSRRGSRW